MGKEFHYTDLETKKVQIILLDARIQILESCCKVEAIRDIEKMKIKLNRRLDNTLDRQKIEILINQQKLKLKTDTEKRLQKKIDFHLGKPEKNVKQKAVNQKRQQKRLHDKQKRSQKNKNRKRKKKEETANWINKRVDEIKKSLVVNLSGVDIPNTAYLYLARGLNFVESNKANKEDLKFDTKEFIRKLEWKSFFHQRPSESQSDETDIHSDLRIPSRAHPPDLKNPLLDEIRSKLIGFVTAFEPEKPKSNLTPAEQRGKSWLIKQIKDQQLFVTKADKGGATLLLDFQTALNTLRTEINNPDNFTRVDTTIDKKMESVQKGIREKVTSLEKDGKLTKHDRLLITGVTDNGGVKHSPVFRASVPYAYPLFKIHKLNEQQLTEKVIPPARLVHATKQGPLYRLEKWCSPLLTQMSRDYCSTEFLLDTPDLLKHIEDLNATWPENDTAPLFTLDVVALYPSISVDMALKAMTDAFSNEQSANSEAVFECSEYILRNSFVTFEGAVYETKKGIPTGNCISRQIADFSMYWLLFRELKIQHGKFWHLIRFWKRFIDDILGRWKGTVRQFHMFVADLNKLALPFGIQFSDAQIGKSVHYLDVELYVDNHGQIQYKLYRKPTDSRQFLNPLSFHPNNVFDSVIFSQLLRVMDRNSSDENCVSDLQELKQDLVNCGHNQAKIEEMEPLAVQRSLENKATKAKGTVPDNKSEAIVFTTKFFKEVNELKTLVRNVEDDIKLLCGNIRIIFALKKDLSISNKLVKNRSLAAGQQPLTSEEKTTQSCGSKRCKLCPLLFSLDQDILINGQKLFLNDKLTCKDKNCIYISQCQICDQYKQSNNLIYHEDSYFGQTVTAVNCRFNGHRSKFVLDDQCSYEKSALSQHCFDHHPDNMQLSNFKIGIVKSVNPIELDREENRFITKFRTDIWGLNRMNVIR